MLKRILVTGGAVAMMASLASASQILTPTVRYAVGDNPASLPAAYWNLAAGFNNQPTLIGGVPNGASDNFGEFSTNASGGIAYLDFGSDWQDYQIEQTWTRGVLFRSGLANPFAAVEWATDTDPASPTLGSADFNFATRAGTGEFTWQLDTDASAAPIRLQAQYVKMTYSSSPTEAGGEFAIVASQVPEPASLSVLGMAAAGVLLRRRQQKA